MHICILYLSQYIANGRAIAIIAEVEVVARFADRYFTKKNKNCDFTRRDELSYIDPINMGSIEFRV